MLTSWNTQCGIAEYSRALVEALQASSDVELLVLGSRNYDERAVAPDEDYVVACFDVEQWNRDGRNELDVERVLELGLDVLHVQFQLALYNLARLGELLERFEGATVITWHDNWVPPELAGHRFDVALTHRLGVGPATQVIPFGVRNMPAIVRTFGLGRTREDIIGPICERNGWTFESAATSEAPFGGQNWLTWRELHDWLRGADAIVLWYAENGLVGSSQAAHTAIATRRPVVVTDTTWFADLSHSPGVLHKVRDEPAALEATLRELLGINPMVAEAAWEYVADLHIAHYRRALADHSEEEVPSPHAAPSASPTSAPLAAPALAAPPPPSAIAAAAAEPLSAATVEEWMRGDVGHLHRAFDLTALPTGSRRRIGGRLVVALKRATRRLLFPVLDVQTSVNAANARAVTFLLEQAAAHASGVEELTRQLAELRTPSSDVPIPSEGLIRRTGWTPGSDVIARYLTDGLAMKELLASLIEAGAGVGDRARVLDFGCGVGKVSRHFAKEADRFELFGCDIDEPSIEWLAANHASYASFFRVAETPGLPCEDGYFDLIYAVSVFTHLTDLWAGWLLELHRTIAPGGLLVVTVLGEGMIEQERGGVWDEEEIGMNVLRRGQDWDGGGPTVFHSHWWIREHWGRAFEIVDIRQQRNGDGSLARGAHEIVIMRPRAASLTAGALELIDPGEPRELRALRRNIAQLHDDDAHLRRLLAEARARGDTEHDQRVEFARQAAEARSELDRLRPPSD